MHAVRSFSLCGFLIVVAAGCGSSPPPASGPGGSGAAAAGAPGGADAALTAGFTPAQSAAELSPALAPLAWWLGTWDAADGKGREHWTANGGALFGVSLDDKGGFEVMVVDDGEERKPADGALRFYAMPAGELPVLFSKHELTASGAVFRNEAHDFPKQVSYRRQGESMNAEISGGGKAIPYGFTLVADPPRAAELEAADRAFAADTAARGIEGWVAAFEADGWMHGGGQKHVGVEAIRALMGPFLAQVRVEWAPVASAVRGDLGYTLGKATFTSSKDGATWKSVYVTLWHRQPDGSWKARFDTGRTVNESFAK